MARSLEVSQACAMVARAHRFGTESDVREAERQLLLAKADQKEAEAAEYRRKAGEQVAPAAS